MKLFLWRMAGMSVNNEEEIRSELDEPGVRSEIMSLLGIAAEWFYRGGGRFSPEDWSELTVAERASACAAYERVMAWKAIILARAQRSKLGEAQIAGQIDGGARLEDIMLRQALE